MWTWLWQAKWAKYCMHIFNLYWQNMWVHGLHCKPFFFNWKTVFYKSCLQNSVLPLYILGLLRGGAKHCFVGKKPHVLWMQSTVLWHKLQKIGLPFENSCLITAKQCFAYKTMFYVWKTMFYERKTLFWRTYCNSLVCHLKTMVYEL